MPNHVRNKLEVLGKPELVAAFVEQARGERNDEGKRSHFAFNSLYPIPPVLAARSFGAERESQAAEEAGMVLSKVADCESQYEWCSSYWGTKWGAYDVSEEEPYSPGDSSAVYEFTCAWGPPTRFLEHVSSNYPELRFILSYGGEGPCLGMAGFFQGDMFEEEGDTSEAPDYDDSEYQDLESRWDQLNDEEKARYEVLEDKLCDAYDAWEKRYIISHDEWVQHRREVILGATSLEEMIV